MIRFYKVMLHDTIKLASPKAGLYLYIVSKSEAGGYSMDTTVYDSTQKSNFVITMVSQTSIHWVSTHVPHFKGSV